MAVGGAPKGNTNATKGKPFAQAIERALQKRSRTDQAKGLEEVANRLIDLAIEGDMPAIKELADRVDGKSKQATELSGSLDIMTHEKWIEMLADE